MSALFTMDVDTSQVEKAFAVLQAETEKLCLEACGLAMSFDVHGSQPDEHDRLAAIRSEVSRGS